MRYNPYAPPAIRGLGQAEDKAYIDIPRFHRIQVDMNPSEFIRDRASEFSDEGDFILRAISVASFTGAFSVQFTDANGYALSNTLINHYAFLGANNSPVPFVIFPEVVFPKSSKISLNILNLTTAANTVVFLLHGVMRAQAIR
jgi:hypothetical protein